MMAPTTAAASALVLTLLPCLFSPARGFLPSRNPHFAHRKAFAVAGFGSATSPPQQRHLVPGASRSRQLHMAGDAEDGSDAQKSAKREVRVGLDILRALVDMASCVVAGRGRCAYHARPLCSCAVEVFIFKSYSREYHAHCLFTRCSTGAPLPHLDSSRFQKYWSG